MNLQAIADTLNQNNTPVFEFEKMEQYKHLHYGVEIIYDPQDSTQMSYGRNGVPNMTRNTGWEVTR